MHWTPFSSFGTWNDSIKNDGARQVAGNEIGAYLNFITKKSQQVFVKVGISMVGISKAQQNVEKEIPNWNFEAVKNKADATWENELKKIEVKSISEKDSRIFYTALYHSMLTPSDWTGENPLFDYKRPYYEGGEALQRCGYRVISPYTLGFFGYLLNRRH